MNFMADCLRSRSVVVVQLGTDDLLPAVHLFLYPVRREARLFSATWQTVAQRQSLKVIRI